MYHLNKMQTLLFDMSICLERYQYAKTMQVGLNSSS